MSARILHVPQNGNGAGTNARQPTDTRERIRDRETALEELLPFVRGRVTGSVASWYELFVVAHDNFEKHLQDGLDHNAALLVMIDRVTKIYAEEMEQSERLAQEARERVAARIVEEFGDAGGQIAEALINDDPQGFGLALDWN